MAESPGSPHEKRMADILRRAFFNPRRGRLRDEMLDLHRRAYRELETALVLDLVDAGVDRQDASRIVGERIREYL